MKGEIPDEDLPPAPDVLPWLEWIWRAWHRLHHDRHWRGGGMGPSIPERIGWSLIQQWADRHGYDEMESTFLDSVLGEMDSVFIEHYIAGLPKAGSKGQ